jgi:hypothetical protein
LEADTCRFRCSTERRGRARSYEALALAQRHHAALEVAHHLDLDVARFEDEPLQIDGVVAERWLGAQL